LVDGPSISVSATGDKLKAKGVEVNRSLHGTIIALTPVTTQVLRFVSLTLTSAMADYDVLDINTEILAGLIWQRSLRRIRPAYGVRREDQEAG